MEVNQELFDELAEDLLEEDGQQDRVRNFEKFSFPNRIKSLQKFGDFWKKNENFK